MHLFLIAKKLAFEDDAHYYADMEFSALPVKEQIFKKYAKERRQLFDPMRVSLQYNTGIADTPKNICLTEADKDSNMVSLIQRNYRTMGSGMTP